ncbi:NEDD8-activating enzyme E1 regulatory subunit [Oopsacas minuta]|uniref:NEDD8-activating enzyme E1 regulatory subunit n=1 Tax=Oopsacas minuta TaxID=111878 RepID=A0AAV7JSW1_9METZ|nr:NEDD8-activating enzyme E1 regulatory subunit [Oopsacas minuta]
MSESLQYSCHLVIRAYRFVLAEGKGDLPLRGTIPDMTSSSKQYIDLQNLYREKARKDALIVHKYVSDICSSLSLSADYIKEEDTLLFCKNSSFLNLIRTTPLEAELSTLHFNRDYFDMSLGDEDSDLAWYVLLRAVERFNTKYSHYPIPTDIPLLTVCVEELLIEWGLVGKKIKEGSILEICRYNGCEIHTVSAFLGGLAAQECIKLITNQYIPINNTMLYNAITSTTLSFEA